MERSAFIGNIARRLGRAPLTAAPVREIAGAPEFYVAEPYGTSDTVNRIERFVEELAALGGETIIADGMTEAADKLRVLLDERDAKAIVTWARSEFAGWPVDWLWDEKDALPLTNEAGDLGSLSEAARAADVGITVVDFAIANTGTLCLVTRPTRARMASLTPTTHIALVRESQIVDRMGEALASFGQWSPDEFPSSVHFISGPSRSSDIENDLTIGVHGPVAVIVLIARGL